MEKSIIVKNLPKYVYVSELCDKFRCFGSIVSASIHFDESNHSGSAYIEFNNSFSALKAVQDMNKAEEWKKTLQVSLSSECERFKKVYVRDFNLDWDECDLLKAFEDVGTVDTVIISKNDGKSNGYGFVTFGNHSTAKRAIEYMNGREIDGCKLVVERFKSKTEREALKENSIEYLEKLRERFTQWNNLYIKNLHVSVKEEELETLFKKFGEVTSVKIAKDENGTSRGFGFLCFGRKEDAKKALENMNGYPLKGKRLQISFKEDGHIRKQYYDLKNKEKDIKIQQYKQRSKSVPKLLPNSLMSRR